MAKKTVKTGKELEIRVADAYRAMGVRKAEHDVELAGHQIDVYVEMETADRALHRIAVEAKDYSKPVGIDIVSGFAIVVNNLRTLKLVDEGVIVSTAGFSHPARNAAKEHGLRLLEPADLDAMAGGVDPVQTHEDEAVKVDEPVITPATAEDKPPENQSPTHNTDPICTLPPASGDEKLTLMDILKGFLGRYLFGQFLLVLGPLAGVISFLVDVFDVPLCSRLLVLVILTALGGGAIIGLSFLSRYKGRYQVWDRRLTFGLLVVTVGALGWFAYRACITNQCPKVVLMVSSELVKPGQTIDLTAMVDDLENDQVVYYWEAALPGLAKGGGPYPSPKNTYTAPEEAWGAQVDLTVIVDDRHCGRKVTASQRIMVAMAPSITLTPTLTSTPTLTPSPTPTSTPTPTTTLTLTPSPTPTPIPRIVPLDDLAAAAGWISGGDNPTDFISLTRPPDDCHTDMDCYRFSYQPGGGWGGVLWWPVACGGPPNYDEAWQRAASGECAINVLEVGGFSTVYSMTFWAKGAAGGERIEFKVGSDPGGIPPTPSRSLGEISLEASWKRYEINLRGIDLTNASALFYWGATDDGNPTGAVFYLDDIQFEGVQ